MMTYEEALNAAQIRQGKCRKVKEMIVERLELPVEPDWITDDQALIGRGLELDSVDTLELMIGMEAEFGVTLMDDEVAQDDAPTLEQLVGHRLGQRFFVLDRAGLLDQRPAAGGGGSHGSAAP